MERSLLRSGDLVCRLVWMDSFRHWEYTLSRMVQEAKDDGEGE